jgi:UDP-N-acetylglucosamine 2-epimerase (non-hydrolysing)
MRKRVLFVFGTRPEAIKFVPLIYEFRKNVQMFESLICVTGQHRQMLDQILSLFDINPDFDLHLMKPDQDLTTLTSDSLTRLQPVIRSVSPDLIFVQGDTTTAFTGTLAAYYQGVKVAHLEAGLRSFNKHSPYPEEINRKIVGTIADYHFSPTKLAKQNLKREGIKENVFVVGNTVVDSVRLARRVIRNNPAINIDKSLGRVDFGRKIVLVTTHRRESFGKPLFKVCAAIRELAKLYSNIEFVFPVHLNPNVRNSVYEVLEDIGNVHLLNPLDYISFIYLMDRCHLILTDSGGIQEEASSLGKPVLVLREVTERLEGIDAGGAILVGTSKDKIIYEFRAIMDDKEHYDSMVLHRNPYGDGKASERIVKILSRNL